MQEGGEKMKKDIFKKAVGIITAILTFLACLGNATGLQAFPFFLALALMYFIVYRGKNWNLWLIVLSGLMFLINLYSVSWVDMIVWLTIIVAYIK